jgi:hypothetical protein
MNERKTGIRSAKTEKPNALYDKQISHINSGGLVFQVSITPS